MLVLRCLAGAILGAIGGSIVGFVGGGVLGLIVFFSSEWNGNRVAWAVILLSILAGIIIGIMIPIREASKRRQAAKADDEARRQRHRDEQDGYRAQMIAFGERSLVSFELMPNHLRCVEEYLDQAEVDFADGAFAPFWDSIENAVKALGRFDECVRHIKDNSSGYSELIKKCEDTPPKFPLAPQSVSKLGVGTTTAERMRTIVRKAQCDFQFATIYEQRKTNQILVAGFTNLAQALKDMTGQLMASINDLASSVDGLASTLDDIAETANRHVEMTSETALEAARRERKVLEMLDNIQRGRRPFP